MAVTIDGTTGVSLVQDGVVTAADLASGAVTADKLSTGYVLINSAEITSSISQLDLSLDTSNYKFFRLYFNGINMSADGNMEGRGSFVSTGTYSGAANYAINTVKKYPTGFDTNTYGGQSQSIWFLSHNVGGATHESWSAIIDIQPVAADADAMPIITMQTAYRDSGGAYVANFGNGMWQVPGDTMNGFRLFPSSGTLDGGKYWLWGMK